LGFDFDQEESLAAVRMRHETRIRRRGLDGPLRLKLPLQAMREIRRLAGHRQVVLDEPRGRDNDELPVLLAVPVVFRMVGQFEPAAGIRPPQPTDAVKTLCPRFPFLHADFGELVATLLLTVGVRARVFVYFGLLGQVALIVQRGNTRTFRVPGGRR
jgi:hypothetical protein